MFLAQAVTIVLAFVIIIGAIASAGQKNKKQAEGHIEVTNVSEDIQDVRDGMQKELLSEDEYKLLAKEKKKAEKLLEKQKKQQLKSNKKSQTENDKEMPGKGRIFVLDFDGDVEASAVENLREEISAIITSADKGDKVLLRLESPGGLVHSYGLAASQLSRIKDAELELIVSVDQVAASGGYMMACVADTIIAAPFAIVGSVGVVAEIPNFHRLLKHNNVDYEQHTAGEYKRTLTMFAENTDDAREKFKKELEETHVLFKEFIRNNREKLDVEKIATGEHWYGLQALELGLIDKIQTSDDFIIESVEGNDIFAVSYDIKQSLSDRLSFSLQSAVEKGFSAILQKSIESRLFKR